MCFGDFFWSCPALFWGIAGGFYLGFTEEEHDILNNGTEDDLIKAGFTE